MNGPRLWLPMLAVCGACRAPPEPSATLDIHVRDDMERSLAGVHVQVDGVRVATSDARGAAHATIHASEAGKLRVSVQCPPQHSAPPARSVPLLLGVATALQLDMVCKPMQRSLALVVRAPLAAGAWVRADGQSVGRIAADGTLHAVLVRPPLARLRLTIDTSELPALTPQHPVHELQVPDRDEIIVFDPPLRRLMPRAPREVHVELTPVVVPAAPTPP